VGTGRENLGDAGGFNPGLRQLLRRTETGATATDNQRVERHRSKIRHNSKPPENLNTPDEVDKHDQTAHRLNNES